MTNPKAWIEIVKHEIEQEESTVQGPNYTAIIKLYVYCLSIGIECNLVPLFDGWALKFTNGGDFIQHMFSYGNEKDMVEPAIGSKADFKATSLSNAKKLVKKHKEKLNNEKSSAEYEEEQG